jgi:hypothetical protein
MNDQADKVELLDWLISTQMDAVKRFGTHWPGYHMMAGFIERQRKIVSEESCEHVFVTKPETQMLLGWRTDTACKKCGKLQSYKFEYFDGDVREETYS